MNIKSSTVRNPIFVSVFPKWRLKFKNVDAAAEPENQLGDTNN